MGNWPIWLAGRRWSLTGEIRSRRSLFFGVARVTLLVVLAADLIDVAINSFVDPEIIVRSLVQTTFTATLMSSIFIGALAKANLELFRANEKLATFSRTDGLTGVLNRRSFFDAAETVRSWANPAYLLVADIDNFKAINDTYGHPAGDEVLQTAGAILRGMFPEPHLVGRLGGEEFGVLLTVPNMLEAEISAEHFRRRVAAHQFSGNDQKFGATVSVGISVLIGERPLREAYVLADSALYEAKNNGRNRTAVSTGHRVPTNLAVVSSR